MPGNRHRLSDEPTLFANRLQTSDRTQINCKYKTRENPIANRGISFWLKVCHRPIGGIGKIALIRGLKRNGTKIPASLYYR